MSRTKIIEEIAGERERQVSGEGWTETHDDEHSDGALALSAAAYLVYVAGDPGLAAELFPWDHKAWKKLEAKDERRRLVIAAALIVAEIERLDRAKARGH